MSSRAPWSHSAIKRPFSEQQSEGQAGEQDWIQVQGLLGPRGGSGAEPGPAKLSLHSGAEAGARDSHQLAQAALENVKGS